MYKATQLKYIIHATFEDSYDPPHELGPDHVLEAKNFTTTNPQEAVKLRNHPTEVNFAPTTLISTLKNVAEKNSELPALSIKRNYQWNRWTYDQFYEETRTVAKAFLKLGLGRYEVVANLGFNAPEWQMSFFGTMMAGGITTGIYITNTPDACHYILNHSKAHIVVVSDDCQLKKILQIRDSLTHLKVIIQYTGTPSHEDVFSWDQILQIGRSVPDAALDKRIKSLTVNQCCSIVYTSGTTGNPKAVMMHHDNYLQTDSRDKDFSFGDTQVKSVSFLPLNHLAGQIMDLWTVLKGGHVYFAAPDALKGSLIETMQEVQPTIFLSVPRLYEKMKESFDKKFAEMNFVMKYAIKWALQCGYEHTISCLKGDPVVPFGYGIAKKIIHNITEKIGFSQAKYLVSGGAPISDEVINFFLSLELFIQNGYGMTESSSVAVVNTMECNKYSSAGKRDINCDLKIHNPDDDGVGEICMKGRSVFMGYLYDEKATNETIDPEGWLHSGDLGRIDEDGFLFVTGRIKEMVITAGGENIASVPIEETVKRELPVVSQAVLIGDKRKYLVMLLTLKTEVDPITSVSLDALSEEAIEWCRENGSQAKTMQDILQNSDSNVMDAIQKGIDRANLKAVSSACRIQKWKILPRDFSIHSEELTPTMKLRRLFINEKHKDVIDSLYS